MAAEKPRDLAIDSLDILEQGGWFSLTTRGDALRFAVAHAAFLDYLFTDDEVVGQIVDQLNTITGAPAIIEGLGDSFARRIELVDALGLFTEDGDPLRPLASLAPTERAELAELDRRWKDLASQSLAILEGSDEEQVRSMLQSAAHWTARNGVGWPWLVRDLVLFYRDKVLHQNPYGGWRGSFRRELHEWTFTPIDTGPPEHHLQIGDGETPAGFRLRARREATEFLKDLDDDLPDGRVPDEMSAATIERNVWWLYEHRLRRRPKLALAHEEFGDRYERGDDYDERIRGRTKDVRDGIASASDILGATGIRFRAADLLELDVPSIDGATGQTRPTGATPSASGSAP